MPIEANDIHTISQIPMHAVETSQADAEQSDAVHADAMATGRPMGPYSEMLRLNNFEFDAGGNALAAREGSTITLPGSANGFSWDRARRNFGDQPLRRGAFHTNSWGLYLNNKWKGMDNTIKRGAYGFDAILGKISDDEAMMYGNRDYLDTLNGHIPDMKTNNLLLDAAGEASSISRYMLSSTWAGAKTGLTTAGIWGAKALLVGQLGPQAAAAEEVFTVPAAMLAGGKIGAKLGVIYNSMKVEGGDLYLDMREAGISKKTAAPAALAAGLFTGLIEVSSLKVMGKFYKQSFMAMVSNNPAVERWLLKTAGAYLKTIGYEIGQEVLQDSLQMAAKVYADMVEDNPNIDISWDDYRAQMVDTIVATAKGTAVIGLPGIVSHTASQAIENKEGQKIVEGIKNAAAQGEAYVKSFGSKEEANAAAEKIETAIGHSALGADVAVDDNNNVIVTNTSGLAASDILSIAKQQKDGTFVVKLDPKKLDETLPVIEDAFAEEEASIEVDPTGKKLTITTAAETFAKVAQPTQQQSVMAAQPYIEQGGVKYMTGVTESSLKAIKKLAKSANANIMIDVQVREELDEDGTYDVEIETKNLAIDLSENKEFSKAEVTIENLRTLTEEVFPKEMADARTLESAGKAFSSLLQGKPLDAIERTLFPFLAENEADILTLVRALDEAQDPFQYIKDERALINLLLEELEQHGELAAEQLDALKSAIRKSTTLTLRKKSRGNKLLRQQFKTFLSGIKQGKKMTTQEIKHVQGILIDAIKKSIPKDKQGDLISLIKTVRTAEDFIRQSDKIFSAIEKARQTASKARILGIDTKKLANQFAQPVKLIQSLLKDKSPQMQELLTAVKPLAEHMSENELRNMFAGEGFDANVVSAATMERIEVVLDSLVKVGKLEKKLLTIDVNKKKAAVLERFRKKVAENGTAEQKEIVASYLQSAKGDMADMESKSLIKSWISRALIRFELMYSWMGLEDIFTSLSHGNFNSVEGQRVSTGVIDSILKGVSVADMYKTDLDFSEPVEITAELLAAEFGIDEINEALYAEIESLADEVIGTTKSQRAKVDARIREITKQIEENLESLEGQTELKQLKIAQSIKLTRAMALYAISMQESNKGIEILQETGFTLADIYTVRKTMQQKYGKYVDMIQQISDFLTNDIGERVRQTQIQVGMDPMELLTDYFSFVGSLEANPTENTLLLKMLEGSLKTNDVSLSENYMLHRDGGAKKLKEIDFLKTVYNYVSTMEAFIHTAPSMHDAQVILADKGMRDVIESTFGRKWYREMWVQLAQLGGNNVDGSSKWAPALKFIRENVYPMWLGLNTWSIMKMAASASQGIYYVGGKYSMRGFHELMVDPVRVIREVKMRAPVIRHRSQFWERDLQHLTKRNLEVKKSKARSVIKLIQQGVMAPNKAADFMVCTGLWWGAYTKAIEQDGMGEDAARDAATAVITQTQPMGGTLYLPAAFRGNEAEKMFTMFMNQTNQNMNMVVSQVYNIKNSNLSALDKSLGAAKMGIFLIAIPAFIIGMLNRRMRMPDEPEEWGLDILNYATSPFPIVGKLAESWATDKHWSSFGVVGALNKDMANFLTEDDPYDKFIKAIDLGLGWGAGIPTRNARNLATFKQFEEKKK